MDVSKTRKTTVFCRLQFEGFHYWPDAGGTVSYLQYPHRHMFHVEAAASVAHNDRDIEIITMKKEIQKHCNALVACGLGTSSCEQLCHAILDQFSYLDYVEVSEDGENGARVHKIKECTCEC